jgi:ATP-dependent RNA helicase RhlE
MSPHPTDLGFASFSLVSPLVSAIKGAGFETPTDLQHAAIPHVLNGEDVLVRAATGSGKTAAFVLPLLHALNTGQSNAAGRGAGNANPSPRAKTQSVKVLVLVPTRELAVQIGEVFQQFSKGLTPRPTSQSVYGGVKINPQMMALRGGTDILVTTPGRLLDLAENNAVKFHELQTLIVDEADRMMKGDFEDEIKRIIALLPNDRQNLMFTATFPDDLRPIVQQMMNSPTIINMDETRQETTLDQRVLTVNGSSKNDLLAHLLKENDWQRVLIFCSAKRTCDNLAIKLGKRGIDTTVMHGNREQSARLAALRNFKAGDIRILIATDVAARGIDIEFLPCVINFDLPRSPNDYIHRVGRTARAGQPGQAITLLCHDEYAHFRVVEKRLGFTLEREQFPGFEANDTAPEAKNGDDTAARPTKKRRISKKQRLRQAEMENKVSGNNPD